jgi:hypothetical protein
MTLSASKMTPRHSGTQSLSRSQGVETAEAEVFGGIALLRDFRQNPAKKHPLALNLV